MRLKQLLQPFSGFTLHGPEEIEILGASSNSKDIQRGFLFIVKNGREFRGSSFIPEAIALGAAALLSDRYDPNISLTQIVHPDPTAVESLLVGELYQHPSKQLKVIGVTGTKGKTTTTYLIKQLLDQLDLPCGLIGSIEALTGQRAIPAKLTTPDLATCQRLLREMCSAGCTVAVMEVSSIGIDQSRVEGIAYEIGIFTNLSRDHLDYHATMENYRDAKRKFFRTLAETGTALMNGDDPSYPLMREGCPARVFTFSIDAPSDLRATEIKFFQNCTAFAVDWQGKRTHFDVPLIGKFNVYNLLAAILTALILGASIDIIAVILKQAHAPKGRLQRVANALGIPLFVDHAHTGDALENVLKSLKPYSQKRLIVIFGCGGNRDRGRRGEMAAAASRWADQIIITNDNPRSENPLEIAHEILGHFTDKERVILELDRRSAIRRGIEMAEKGDLLLIAGKGHETYQIYGDQRVHFDDMEVASELCEEKWKRVQSS